MFGRGLVEKGVWDVDVWRRAVYWACQVWFNIVSIPNVRQIQFTTLRP